MKVTPRDAKRSSEYIALSANQHPTQITKTFQRGIWGGIFIALKWHDQTRSTN
jgi:hypothetical protein